MILLVPFCDDNVLFPSAMKVIEESIEVLMKSLNNRRVVTKS